MSERLYLSALTSNSTSTTGSGVSRKQTNIKTLHARVGRGILIDCFFPNAFHRILISWDDHKYYVKKEFLCQIHLKTLG